MVEKKVTILDIQNKKRSGKKITMLTAYDYFLAKIVDEAGIDVVLVGDSLGMVVLGYESTVNVTMDDMIRHTQAARRGIKRSLLIGDMPYKSFETVEAAAKNAKRFVEEAGCDAVKLEGESYEAVSAIIKCGIPVLGHLGLTPQTAVEFKVQGKNAEAAKAIADAARRLERLGCFSIVLECIPSELAEIITSNISIPTIGIGAGPACDGQVLVLNDLLGMFDRFMPKFAKKYADVGAIAKEAVSRYKEEVEKGIFPKKENSFTMRKEELEKIK
ncbi:MAG: 3-methyl-2-oxobutanoate hydroxymethyltransferase [Candidatus Omnitrophica bacterium]|nr:3-methyl-2-oxobutanoate hydroxymethyltransferase [Candidatus Omnitrophota bacterium]MBU4488536.1 3-methyl-2-oxobutanoate hydroxymethyltransferase [Candidatus Omnitrophota bacterium]